MVSRTEAGQETTGDGRARTFATLVGAAFLAVGILGFVPGITSNYDDMAFSGHDSGAELLGVFQVSVLHNLVHVAFGVAGLVAARAGWRAARNYLLAGGVIYLALWLYGLVIDKGDDANFVPLNRADDWLHFVLGIGMIGLGVLAGLGARDRGYRIAR
jgi:hypothetical protein